MRIPSNIIDTGKYTIGKEFINTSDKKEYQGYYYQVGDRYFAGKSFSQNAPELKKVTDNSFYFDNINKEYSSLTKVDPSTIIVPKTIHNRDMSQKDAQGQYYYTYYAKKINSNPILIREIDKETYLELQNKGIWQVISIITTQGDGYIDSDELDRAEKEMPGIKTWISSNPGAGSL